MKTSIHIEDCTTTELRLHPMQEKVYGRESVDAGLVETIREVGIIEPLIVDQDGRIVSGSRRWKAAIELMLGTVPIRRVEGSDLELTELLIKANQQRSKTAGQKAREATALFRIEKTRAAEREKAGVTLGSEVAKGRASEIVAKLTGQSRATVEKQVEIVEKAEAGSKIAIGILEMLDTDERSLAEAHRYLKELEEWEEHQEKKRKGEAEEKTDEQSEARKREFHQRQCEASERESAQRREAREPLEAARKTEIKLLDIAEQLISAGKKSLAQKAHPDHGGSTEGMQLINAAAQWLLQLVNEERQRQVWHVSSTAA